MATEKQSVDDGGPAFPTNHGSDKFNAIGMSLRDYFAGQAIAGFATRFAHETYPPHSDPVASLAYELADALLRARGERA